MKKIIIALLCAFTLFAFASCSGDTPAPDTGTDTARWDTVPEELRGTWEYSLGEGYPTQSYVITADNIVFYSSEDAEGFSLKQNIYEGVSARDSRNYGVINADDHSNAYIFFFPTAEKPNDITVRTYSLRDNKTYTELSFTKVGTAE